MLSKELLMSLARKRFEEAKTLLQNNQPDGAVYLCGYALEMVLKWKIVKLLEWEGYPDSRHEFENLQTFKTHQLSVLLRLAGLEKKIQNDNTIYARWQVAGTWDSQIRYREIGAVQTREAQDTIEATRQTINFILTT